MKSKLKKTVLLFLFFMAGNILLLSIALLGNAVIAEAGRGGGCINQPSSNNGVCVESTHNGNVTYTCSDASWWQSKDCVKGKRCHC